MGVRSPDRGRTSASVVHGQQTCCELSPATIPVLISLVAWVRENWQRISIDKGLLKENIWAGKAARRDFGAFCCIFFCLSESESKCTVLSQEAVHLIVK